MALGFRGANKTPGSGASENKKAFGGSIDSPKEVDQLPREDDYDPSGKSTAGKSNTVLFVVGAVVVLLLGIGVASQLGKGSGGVEGTEVVVGSNKEETDGKPASKDAVYDEYGNLISENGIYTPEGEVIDDDAINPGVTDYASSDKNTTTPYVYEASDFIKDLNGLDVSAVYNVQSRSYVKDYATYESRRAIMDDGMELYWLEVVYKQKKYRVQVPFYYFKDLGTEGICKVEMEILTLEGGEKIISYMQVVGDEVE